MKEQKSQAVKLSLFLPENDTGKLCHVQYYFAVKKYLKKYNHIKLINNMLQQYANKMRFNL